MRSHMNYVVLQLKTDITNLNWLLGFHARVVDICVQLLASFGTSADDVQYKTMYPVSSTVTEWV
jgi:hypothetical protein